MSLSRRALVGSLALSPLVGYASKKAKILIIGGGFGGAMCARTLKRLRPHLNVTLIDPNEIVTTCPMSNAVIGGLLPRSAIEHRRGTDKLTQVRDSVRQIDPATRRVQLRSGISLAYDRLVLAPGVSLCFDRLEGYSQLLSQQFPHAWHAGPQTELLQQQVANLRSGGVFVMTIPDNPYRCPPGPYERASLIAHYLQRHNPRAKVLLLDAKDDFTKKPLFLEAWQQLYPGMIEWVARSQGGNAVRLDVQRKAVITEFADVVGDVINVIPPQQAADICTQSGLDSGRGWCDVEPMTFESKVQPFIHLLGDSINASPMPKSAFAAASQAKACARAIVRLLEEQPPVAPILINTC